MLCPSPVITPGTMSKLYMQLLVCSGFKFAFWNFLECFQVFLTQGCLSPQMWRADCIRHKGDPSVQPRSGNACPVAPGTMTAPLRTLLLQMRRTAGPAGNRKPVAAERLHCWLSALSAQLRLGEAEFSGCWAAECTSHQVFLYTCYQPTVTL